MLAKCQAPSRRLIFACIASCLAGIAMPAESTEPLSKYFPPWSHGENNPVRDRGLEFTVPEIDNLPDFHGDPASALLSIFVGGNYYFAMAPLVAEFSKQHPEYAGRIYYETIPPGLLVEQIKKNGTITVGNMTWTVHADVYAGGLMRVNQIIHDGYATGPAVPYATNTLTIMVPKGNPSHVSGLADLARPGLHLVMPNPAFEGIGRQIKLSLEKAGGGELVKSVYETKVAAGETYMTRIHHRESPLYLMLGRAEAGVTWQSEAIFQEEVGNPISQVAIPAAQNTIGTYAAVILKDAPHREAGQKWVEFLRSAKAMAVFEHYGFKPYAETDSH